MIEILQTLPWHQILLNVTRHSAGEAIPSQDLSTAIAFTLEMCMHPRPS
jgi:hypothetical protein